MGISEAMAISHRFSDPASVFRPRFCGRCWRGSRGNGDVPALRSTRFANEGAEAASKLNTVGYNTPIEGDYFKLSHPV